MKKVLIGAAVGAAVVCVVAKLYKQGKFDSLCDDVNKLGLKAKRNLKIIGDAGKHEVEYIKDRVEHELDKIQK